MATQSKQDSQHVNKPTPGPWEVESGMVQTAKHDHYSGKGIPIAWMDRESGNGTMPVERDANARLIAAAPDLLAALHSILEHSKEFGDIEDYETMLVRIEDKARAAIREVEGR